MTSQRPPPLADAGRAARPAASRPRRNGAHGLRRRRARAAASAVGTAALLASAPAQAQAQAQAQARSWSTTGFEETVALADCRDCGDDLGMLIKCQGRGRPAKVYVPWSAVETGEDGAFTSVAISVDDRRYEREGRVEFWGQVGYMPTFLLSPTDILIGELQSAHSVTIEYAGSLTTIGLRGSRDAFDVFRVRCGWHAPLDTRDRGGVRPASESDESGAGQQSAAPVSQQQSQQPAAPVPQQSSPARPGSAPNGEQVEPDPSGARWFVDRYTHARSGASGVSLTFGIPETDAIALHARCEAGNPGPFVPIDIIADFGGKPDGVPVQVSFRTGEGATSGHPGTVFVQSSEWAGIRTAISIDDPLWQTLRSGARVAFGMDGAPSVSVPTAGAQGAIQEFVAACRSTFSS